MRQSPGNSARWAIAALSLDRLSRIQGYYVMLAGSAPSEQPGMPCAIRAANARRREAK
jgi:hypothetical protein